MEQAQQQKVPRVVIVGGGFAGINLARGLKRAPVEILLLDRHNVRRLIGRRRAGSANEERAGDGSGGL